MNEEQARMGDAALSMSLRGLRQDVEPARDLWPGIAARLQAPAQQPVRDARTRHPRWLWPVAAAASLVFAVGLAWQLDTPLKPTGSVVRAVAQASRSNVPASLVEREADSMTVHYEAALRELAPQSAPASWQPGLDALDHSAVQIRSAMQHDPNSRLLLQRLRSTYTRRLALARQALYA